MTHVSLPRQLAVDLVARAEGPTFWFPSQASTIAADVDFVYYFIYWISVFFTLLIVAVATWFIIQYRSTRNSKVAPTGHSTALELTWTFIPGILVVIIFYFGFVAYMDMRTPPDDAYEVNVTGFKWAWSFTYPNGHVDSALHVPVDEPVRLVMTSEDVIHSFFVPAFRVKQDVVPGRYTSLWFQATQSGEFQVFCTEYCGTKHSDMLTKVVVHPPGQFARWLAEAADIHARLAPAAAGEQLVKSRGCLQCHSLDGAPGIGPTFRGAWGSARRFTDGSAGTVDENYVRSSILDPQAQVVTGFAGVMPTFQGKLDDRDITAIIAYLKTLK